MSLASASLEVADKGRGLFATASVIPVDGRAAVIGVVFDGDEPVLSAAPGPHELRVADGEVSAGPVTLALGPDGAVSARISSEGGEAEIRGVPSAYVEAGPAADLSGWSRRVARCHAAGEVSVGGERRDIGGPGLATVGDGLPEWRRLWGLRRVGAAMEDGGLLTVETARPRGAEGHGEDAMSSAILDGAGRQEPLHRMLLSTQLDSDGMPFRATIEADVETEEGEADSDMVTVRALRGAGTWICGTTLRPSGLVVHTGFLDWTIEGCQGVGGFEVTRKA